MFRAAAEESSSTPEAEDKADLARADWAQVAWAQVAMAKAALVISAAKVGLAGRP